MIHRIYSDLPTFKEVTFRPGLNILLADESEGASDRQTRNGSGKSSLVEIVHLIMGSSVETKSIFRVEELVPYSFGMDFDLQGAMYTVERSGQDANKIVVSRGDPGTWPVKSTTELSGETRLTLTNWRRVLSALLFGLSNSDDGPQHRKYGPTFRSLFSYFARRQSAGAFSSPFKQTSDQQLWDQQVAITFILGLDWTIPQEFQTIRDREQALQELRKAARSGAFGAIVSTTADLRTKIAVAEGRSQRLRAQVSGFRVAAEYRNAQTEASKLTAEMADQRDDNAVDAQMLSQLERALAREEPPAIDDLERLYAEVGLYLPDAMTRRFEEVRLFHESVVENRRLYLQGEIIAARERLATRARRARQIEPALDNLMLFLGSHGALDQYAELQNMLSRQEAEIEGLRRQFIVAEQLEGGKTALNLDRNRLLGRLLQDYHEQDAVLRQAIRLFEEISHALYEDAGSLSIEGTDNGPKFQVVIHGARSRGISTMQIFCFDMMIMHLCRERGIGPDFLIHDSHIFDGADVRQVARALSIGRNYATELRFQYIVTMNSDVIPSGALAGFDIESHILSTRLTDASDDGGIFGIRFG